MLNIDEIKQKYTPETGLLILFCRFYFGTANTEDINSYIRQHDINWNFFHQLVRAHDIRPLIYKVLSKKIFLIEDNWLQILHKNVFKLSAANIERFRELLRLQEIFAANNVKAIPVKGIILSQLLYNDIVSRETCDIDYFITPDEFPAVRKILLSEGYLSTTFYSEQRLKRIISDTREHKMYRKAGNMDIRVELQWQPALNNVDIPLKNDYLLRDLYTVNVAGKEVQTLNIENYLLTLMVHHGVNDIWRTLKHVLDIGLLCKKYAGVIDWERFQANARRYKIEHTAQIGFILSHQLLGTEIPYIIEEKNYKTSEMVRNNLLKFPLIKRRRSFILNLRQQLSMRDSGTDKLNVLKAYVVSLFNRMFFNPTQD